MSRDDAHLIDIAQAAQNVIEFIRGSSKESFLKDTKTQSAVLHQLLIMGEAVKRLSDPFRNQNAEIPWKKIAGMRDRLIHGYDEVNLSRVWKTASKDIAELVNKLDNLTSTLSRKS